MGEFLSSLDWAQVLTTGGVVYLIFERLFDLGKTRAEVSKAKTENAESAIPLYREIREIVRSEVEPIKEELEYIKVKWCCFRDDCEARLPLALADDKTKQDYKDRK